MGSSDGQGIWKERSVPQELVLITHESTDEFRDELMVDIQESDTVLSEKVQVCWNTWKGVYVKLADHCEPWTVEEFKTLWDFFENHLQVIRVDYSYGGGSDG